MIGYLDRAMEQNSKHRQCTAQRLKKAAALALLALCDLSLNLHLFVLQLYGWSGMFAEARQSTDSWFEAATQTIRGEKPCDICRQVGKAMIAERQSGAPDEPPMVSSFPFQILLFLPLAKRLQTLSAPSSHATLLAAS